MDGSYQQVYSRPTGKKLAYSVNVFVSLSSYLNKPCFNSCDFHNIV